MQPCDRRRGGCYPVRVNELIDSEGDLASPRAVDAMRGALLLMTNRWIADHGDGARYRERLSPAARDAFAHATASEWIALVHVIEHYRSLDQLELSDDVIRGLGAVVSDSVNGIFVKTVARLAGTAGASPMLALGRSAKIFARSYRGGAAAAYRTGEREVRFEGYGIPFASSRFHRAAMEGAMRGGLVPFARTVRVTEIAGRRTESSYAFRISW